MAIVQLLMLNELNLCVQVCQAPLFSLCPEEGEAGYSQSEAPHYDSSGR